MLNFLANLKRYYFYPGFFFCLFFIISMINVFYFKVGTFYCKEVAWDEFRCDTNAQANNYWFVIWSFLALLPIIYELIKQKYAKIVYWKFYIISSIIFFIFFALMFLADWRGFDFSSPFLVLACIGMIINLSIFILALKHLIIIRKLFLFDSFIALLLVVILLFVFSSPIITEGLRNFFPFHYRQNVTFLGY